MSPAAPGPKPADGAEQRRFPGAGFALDQHALARRDHGGGAGDHRGAVGEGDLQASSTSASAAPSAVSSMVMVGCAGSAASASRSSSASLEGREARDRAAPFGDAREVVDEPVERRLHLAEGGADLHQPAQRHRARRNRPARRPRWGRSSPACHRRWSATSGCAGCASGRASSSRTLPNRLREAAPLVGFAADQRDALAAFARARQAEAEIRLGRGAADVDAAPSAGRPARSGPTRPAHRAAPPRPCSPGCRGWCPPARRAAAPTSDHRMPTKATSMLARDQQADGELHRQLGGDAHILGDALVGVVGLGRAGLELVVTAFVQPARRSAARSAIPASAAGSAA